MVHLRIFFAAFRESDLLKLPIQMITTIFERMTESNVVILILKMVRWAAPGPYTIRLEVWHGADDDTARLQNLPDVPVRRNPVSVGAR
jgi:hypothetical protein